MATWLITGCSTGLGRAFAEAVLARGDNVVATARDAARSAGPSEMPCMRGDAAQISSTLTIPRAVSRIAWIRIGRVMPAFASSCASSRST